MGMTSIVRFECDKCGHYRDIIIGNTEDRGVHDGITMSARWRIRAIGWKIHLTDASKSCLCGKCALEDKVK